jgi:hypothetical protein
MRAPTDQGEHVSPPQTLLALLIAALPQASRGAAAERLPIVVRTRKDLFIGSDLRFGDGTFRLRCGGRGVELPEPDVARVTFLRPLQDDAARNPALAMAFRLATHRGLRPHRPLPGEGIFLLPDDPLPQTFAWMAHKVEGPELLALLCADLAVQAVRQKKSGLSAAILERAAALETAPPRRLVYLTMRLAVLVDQGRRPEAEETLARLVRDFPQHRDEMMRLRLLLRRPEPPP